MKKYNRSILEALHIFTLTGFALAQPVFDLLGKNADFFVFRRSASVDIVILSIILSLLIPFLFTGLKYILGRINTTWENNYHRFLIFFLFNLLFLPILKRTHIHSAYIILIISFVASSIATLSYFRFDLVRQFFTILSPATILFPFIFILSSPIFSITSSLEASRAASVGIDSRPPIILIVFDEFPTISLLDEDLNINSERYPNFASFASHSYWFRNATTVHYLTDVAVPAILTGRYPSREKKLSIFSDYPENLFTLLSGSYNHLHVFETATRLCPASLCETSISIKPADKRIPELLRDTGVLYMMVLLPEDIITDVEWLNRKGNEVHFWSKIDQTTSNHLDKNHNYNPANLRNRSSARIKQLDDFLNSISKETGSLYFLHTLLPHIPFEYLPSGKKYTNELIMPGWDWQNDQWSNEKVAVNQAYRRHLMQVAFTDKIIKKIVDRLKNEEIYDESLIIVTADHGISFKAGNRRRYPGENTRPEITNVPLFIKFPGQKKGIINDSNIETIDILPTITAYLKMNQPWSVDGISVLETDRNIRRKSIAGIPFNSSPTLLIPFIKRKNRIFGVNKTLKNYDSIPNAERFVGRRVNNYKQTSKNDLYISLDNDILFQTVNINSDFIPSYIKGSLSGDNIIPADMDLAISVNGTIQCVTRMYGKQGKKAHFTAMVPENSFQSGKNTVQVYTIEIDDKNNPVFKEIKTLPVKTKQVSVNQ